MNENNPKVILADETSNDAKEEVRSVFYLVI